MLHRVRLPSQGLIIKLDYIINTMFIFMEHYLFGINVRP